MRSCRCRAGYVLVDGQCRRASEALCTSLLGPHARFDGLRSCSCEPGYMSHVSGTCTLGNDDACAKLLGPHARFDGVNNCTCAASHAMSPSGFCVSRMDPAAKLAPAIANRDGAARISSSMSGLPALKALRGLFESLDVNKDAVLSAKEVVAAARHDLDLGPLKHVASQPQRDSWMRELDANGDELLDFKELLALLTGAPPAPPSSDLKGVGQARGEGGASESGGGGEGVRAGGAGERGGEAGGVDGGDLEGNCRALYGEGAMYEEASGTCACKEGYEATDKEGCQPTLDTECKRQFGEGAYFDGEMCDCREGYKINKAGTMCEPKKANKDKRKSDTTGGSKARGGGGGASKGKSDTKVKDKGAKVTDKAAVTEEDREASRRKTAGDVAAARLEAERIRDKQAATARSVAEHLQASSSSPSPSPSASPSPSPSSALSPSPSSSSSSSTPAASVNSSEVPAAMSAVAAGEGGAGGQQKGREGKRAGAEGKRDGLEGKRKGVEGEKEGAEGKKEGAALSEEEKEMRMQRRKKREAERRWKQYFKDDAMAALNVLNKAKEAESISDKFKRPLAVATLDSGTNPAVSLADPSGSPNANASVAMQASDDVKPPPLSDQEFEAQLAKLNQARRPDVAANSSSSASSSSSSSSTSSPPPAATESPNAAVSSALEDEREGPRGRTASGGGENGLGSERGKGAGGELDGGTKFCKETYGEFAEYDLAAGQCGCMKGYKEDAAGTCVANGVSNGVSNAEVGDRNGRSAQQKESQGVGAEEGSRGRQVDGEDRAKREAAERLRKEEEDKNREEEERARREEERKREEQEQRQREEEERIRKEAEERLRKEEEERMSKEEQEEMVRNEALDAKRREQEEEKERDRDRERVRKESEEEEAEEAMRKAEEEFQRKAAEEAVEALRRAEERERERERQRQEDEEKRRRDAEEQRKRDDAHVRRQQDEEEAGRKTEEHATSKGGGGGLDEAADQESRLSEWRKRQFEANAAAEVLDI